LEEWEQRLQIMVRSKDVGVRWKFTVGT
jgi:hypothetical protein